MDLSFKEAQKKVDKWVGQFKEGYWPPLAMFASLVEEVGELGREINDMQGHKTKKPHSTSQIDGELGDVVFSLICIANYFKIDLEQALMKTLSKYSIRDSNRWSDRARRDLIRK